MRPNPRIPAKGRGQALRAVALRDLAAGDRADHAARVADRHRLAVHVALNVACYQQRTLRLDDQLLPGDGDVLPEHGRRSVDGRCRVMLRRSEERRRRRFDR